MHVRLNNVTAATGRVGGIQVANTRGGITFGIPYHSTRQRTLPQRWTMATFGDLNQRWTASLTDDQRAGWDAYAATVPLADALGNLITMTGRQAYVRGSDYMPILGQPTRDNPPTANGPAPLNIKEPAILQNPGQVRFNLTTTDPWQTHSGSFLIIWRSEIIPDSNATNTPRQSTFTEAVITLPFGPRSFVSFFIDPPLTSGHRIRFRARVYEKSGRASNDRLIWLRKP